jgi:hypothetical protein
MHFLESSGGGPSKTRQKEIDQINQEAAVKPEEAKPARDLLSGDIADISKIDTDIAQLSDIQRELEANKGAVGPVDSRVGKFMEIFGGDTKGAAYRQKITDFYTRYRNAVTGANFSSKENADLQAASIVAGDTEEQIKAKIPGMLKGLQRVREKRLENLKAARFDTSGLEKGGAAPAASQKLLRIPKSDTAAIAEAEKRGRKYEVIEG